MAGPLLGKMVNVITLMMTILHTPPIPIITPVNMLMDKEMRVMVMLKRRFKVPTKILIAMMSAMNMGSKSLL